LKYLKVEEKAGSWDVVRESRSVSDQEWTEVFVRVLGAWYMVHDGGCRWEEWRSVIGEG